MNARPPLFAALLGACLVTSCGVSSNGTANTAQIALNDPATPLTIANWVKGQPVDPVQGSGVYVVEFWATWCPPCRASIPHLTEVQKKYKDRGVTIVGISDEELDTVEKFVQKMGDKMDYIVAIDDGSKTAAGYMGKYGQGGIPHAFLVKAGKVVWHGHPMDNLEAAIEAAL